MRASAHNVLTSIVLHDFHLAERRQAIGQMQLPDHEVVKSTNGHGRLKFLETPGAVGTGSINVIHTMA